ncbi:MAG TPA: hypothetical protein VF618_27080 [Thermoanaerobaculia bacterium]
MKRITILALSAMMALPLFAADAKTLVKARQLAAAANQTTTLQAERLPDSLAVEMLQKLEARKSRVGASAVSERTRLGFVIPAAGSVAGGGGSLFFRSDVTLFNNDETDQHVMILWLPAGGSNPQIFRLTQPLPADAPPITAVDFVGSVLGVSGLGSLVFVPVQSSGAIDEFAALDGYSRIWTRQPGSNGTVSQPFPGVDAENLDDQIGALALGLRHDASFRTNFGLVNLDDQPHTFIVVAVGERHEQELVVTVPAMSMVQQAIPAGDYGALSLLVLNDRFDDNAPEYSWIAYASSTDNITGDGWVSIAAKTLTAEEIAAGN